MTTHIVPENKTMGQLMAIVQEAKDNDTVIVPSQTVRELVERAFKRMNKNVKIKVQP